MTLQYAIAKWVDAFNRADVEALIAIYDVDAIHYPASGEPVVGRDAIRELLSIGTTAAPNFKCFVAGVQVEGGRVILDWHDEGGANGRSTFQFDDELIVSERFEFR